MPENHNSLPCNGGEHAGKDHMALLMDCAEICQLAEHSMMRMSPIQGITTKACADVCDACAESCDKLKGEEMKRCAQACRTCAESCLAMA